MRRWRLFLGLCGLIVLGLLALSSSSAASLSQYPNPLIVVSNEGQAGPNVDKTLIQNTVIDPAPNWRTRFFDAAGWQDAYPVMRASAWTTGTDIAPLLNDGADHVWGGAPGAFGADAGNTSTYPRRYDGSDYANGYAIPASPSPQYLFLRKDFCLPISAQANAQRRLTAGDIEIHLLNATDSAGIPDGAASVYLNGDIIAWIPGDESSSVAIIDVPDPSFLFRGRNALTMRVGDARSDDMAAILYRARFGFDIDPNAIVVSASTVQPFEGETVNFSVSTDGLSGRSPYGYQWTFGDGDAGTGDSVNHTYETTGPYTVSLTIADTDACTATAAMPLTVLPHPLSIEKTARPDPVTAGETLRYRLTVRNSSPERGLTGLVVTDTLPPGTTFNFCPGVCTSPTPPDRTVVWNLASLGPGSSTTLDLYVDVDLTVSGTLTNALYGVRANEVYTAGAPLPVEVTPPPCLYPLTGVDVAGPASGLIDVTHTFTAAIQPSYATGPVAYTWTPEPLGGQGTLAASYQWTDPGVYTVTIEAENCGGVVRATHFITISHPCPHPLTGVGIDGPTTGFTDTAYTFSGVVTPADASEPITYTWAPSPTVSGQGTPTATYEWADPGVYTLTLRADRSPICGGGAVTATHTITISHPCPHPLTGVGIDGPAEGLAGIDYAFTAVITPADASGSITYTWSPAPTVGGQGTPTATYQWSAPGAYTLTLRADRSPDCGGGFVTATHAITISYLCLRPLTGVSIDGPTAGYTDTDYTFSGIVAPADASEPLTYTWSPAPTVSGQGTPAATYQWADPDVYTLTLRAENCGGPFTATHGIHVEPRRPSFVYLPLILRHYPYDAPDTCPGWSLAIAEPLAEDFDHLADDDWYTFQATAGVSYTVRTENLDIHADTVITLYDGTCTTPLVSNDDLPYPSNSRASRVTWRAEQTGPLHVLVRSYDPAATGPQTGYSIAVYDESNPPPPPIEDVADFCEAAHPLAIGERYRENVDYPNDNDWYAFPVTAGRTYTITTDELGPRADTVLALWSGDCATQLAENNDVSPGNPASQIVWTATEDGRLAVNVRHYDWTIYSADTEYTLVVEEE